MKRRKHRKLDQHFVSTEHGLAATIGFLPAPPVGGEIFLLTSPFIEHWATSRYPILCLGHASSSWLVVIGTGVSGEPILCKSPENRKRMIENLDPMLEADVPSTKPTA